MLSLVGVAKSVDGFLDLSAGRRRRLGSGSAIAARVNETVSQMDVQLVSLDLSTDSLNYVQ